MSSVTGLSRPRIWGGGPRRPTFPPAPALIAPGRALATDAGERPTRAGLAGQTGRSGLLSALNDGTAAGMGEIVVQVPRDQVARLRGRQRRRADRDQSAGPRPQRPTAGAVPAGPGARGPGAVRGGPFRHRWPGRWRARSPPGRGGSAGAPAPGRSPARSGSPRRSRSGRPAADAAHRGPLKGGARVESRRSRCSIRREDAMTERIARDGPCSRFRPRSGCQRSPWGPLSPRWRGRRQPPRRSTTCPIPRRAPRLAGCTRRDAVRPAVSRAGGVSARRRDPAHRRAGRAAPGRVRRFRPARALRPVPASASAASRRRGPRSGGCARG